MWHMFLTLKVLVFRRACTDIISTTVKSFQKTICASGLHFIKKVKFLRTPFFREYLRWLLLSLILLQLAGCLIVSDFGLIS